MKDKEKNQIACPVCLKSLEAENIIICSICKLQSHIGCAEEIEPPKTIMILGLVSRDDEKKEKIFTCNLCLERQKNKTEMEDIKKTERKLSSEIIRLCSDHNKALEQFKTEHQKSIEKLDKRSRPVIVASWVYIGVFVFMIAITVFLVCRGWAKSPEVSIQYNVGEIIGGILAGVGAATAGIAYAIRQSRRGTED